MLGIRIIPCLQLIGDSLVKTVKFNKYGYIGDPINTVRIFNELEVDELCFLDIRATKENREPNIQVLKHIADECFMPLAYGGGIHDSGIAKEILSIGFEKVILNSVCFTQPKVVETIAAHSGVQSVVGSVDVKKNLFGKYIVYSHDGSKKHDLDLIPWIKRLEEMGVGEILLTSMEREGTWLGYDNMLIEKVTENTSVPVIANGGAGKIEHLRDAVKAGASALALGSMVVYQQQGMGVLVNIPENLDTIKNF